MTNTKKLIELIKKSRYSRKELAEQLGIGICSLSRKICNHNQFKAEEIMLLSRLLKIRDKDEIFFCMK